MFKLKALRLEAGIKRSELARAMNLNQNTVANYENGLREAPYDLLIRFADFFDVSVDYLIGREESGGRDGAVASDVKPFYLSKSEKFLIGLYRGVGARAKSRITEYAELWQASDPAEEG